LNIQAWFVVGACIVLLIVDAYVSALLRSEIREVSALLEELLKEVRKP
jgi:hypothetical protein